MPGLKHAIANAIINYKMNHCKGYKGSEIAEVYILKKDGKKIKINKDSIMTPLHITLNHERKNLKHIVAKEYLKGKKYRKIVPISETSTPLFPFKYASFLNESITQIILNATIDVTVNFQKYLGPEFAGIAESAANVTDVTYSRRGVLKNINIGDNLVFTINDNLTFETRVHNHKVTANDNINDIIATIM